MKRKVLIVVVCATIIVKSFYTFYLSILEQCAVPERALGEIAVATGDTFSYTGAMENYVIEGSYYFFNGREDVYAGRLPHYSVPYFIFRSFAPPQLSHDLVVVVQLIVEILAVFIFFLLLYRISKHLLLSLLGWSLLLFSTNWTSFTYQISPESFSVSLLIFFLYTYQIYTEKRSTVTLIISGINLGLLITLKSYFILVFLIIGADLIFYYFKTDSISLSRKLKRIFAKSILVALPMILLLLPWIVRNAYHFNKFVPLQINMYAGYNYTKADLAFRSFVTAWGGDIIHWEKTSAGCYFIPSDHIPCTFEFPDYAFTKQYGIEEIETVRSNYVKLQKNYSKELDDKVAEQFDRLTNQYKSDKPFRYNVMSPIILAKRFLANSGSYYLPISTGNACYDLWQQAIKLYQSLLYWFSITIGFVCLAYLTFIKKIHPVYLLIVMLLIVLFPIGFRLVEWRYFRTVQPILIISLSFFLLAGVHFLYTLFKRKKTSV